MRIRHAVVAAVATVLLAAAGCAETCPTESPQVSELPASCTERPGEPVSFPVRLCPTCNQTGATCDVDLSAVGTSGDIFLDPRVEVCTGSATCPPACALNTLACTFTAPAAPGTYTVIAYDPASSSTIESTLVVVAGASESCALPTAFR